MAEAIKRSAKKEKKTNKKTKHHVKQIWESSTSLTNTLYMLALVNDGSKEQPPLKPPRRVGEGRAGQN